MKIAIGVPTNRLIKPKTTQSLLALVAYSKLDYEIIISTRGFNTSENRNYIATQACNKGCSHLFFVDDDMIFPPCTLEKLLLLDKDIIGCVYNTKYEVQAPVVEYLNEKEEGIFKCGAIGTGCLLIKTEVFKKIPQIWFTYEWNDNGSIRMSHDWLFCHKAREYGYEVWANSTIEVKHIGLKAY